MQVNIFCLNQNSPLSKRNWLRLLAIHILKSINHTEDGFPESKGKRTNDLEMFDQCTESIEENYNRRIVASEFPLSLAIIIVSIYFLFVSFLVSNFDWDETGGDRKLSFGDAFYFALVHSNHNLHIFLSKFLFDYDYWFGRCYAQQFAIFPHFGHRLPLWISPSQRCQFNRNPPSFSNI
jgi:hypothetical protein